MMMMIEMMTVMIMIILFISYFPLTEKVPKDNGVESDSDHSSKFDFGPPLLFSGDSIDLDNLPDKVQSRLETITIRRQQVGKLGKDEFYTSMNFRILDLTKRKFNIEFVTSMVMKMPSFKEFELKIEVSSVY